MHSISPYPNELFTALSFIGFVLCCIPFPLHLRAGRSCTALYMAQWTGLSCLNGFINSIVWNGNTIDWAPVWCDISVTFLMGSAVAIPAASLCIIHHLYLVSHASHASFTEGERRDQLIFDLGVGIGLPILEMILQCIVQGRRYDIYEDIGCYPSLAPVFASLPILFGLSSIIGLASITYSFLVIRTLKRSRRRFNDVIRCSADSSISSNHYVRLMLLAAVDIVWEPIMNLYYILLSIRNDSVFTSPPGQGLSCVGQCSFPAIAWRSGSHDGAGIDIGRWVFVICAFSFFGFFGFSKECMDQYRFVFLWLRTKAGFPLSSQPACAVTAPLLGMKFKTVPSAGSDGFLSDTPQTSIVTLPEPVLVRCELNVNFDLRSSVGQQNYATIITPEAQGIQ